PCVPELRALRPAPLRIRHRLGGDLQFAEGRLGESAACGAVTRYSPERQSARRGDAESVADAPIPGDDRLLQAGNQTDPARRSDQCRGEPPQQTAAPPAPRAG